MAGVNERIDLWVLHPIHGVLLAGTIPLFLGGLLSDYAYFSSYEIQWANFASWLIAGGLVFCGFALLCSIIKLARTHHRHKLTIIYPLALLATWVLGFLNALMHAKDAWASMPDGLILSVIVLLLACGSTWIGFTKFGVGGVR
ncbi:MAG: hypothetical protein NVV73_00620 [Cellvibrionaceae bacterium]|nr:hypothetical protein [Cellvibrionaceae bacterium]